jgi:hypothetical protein
MENLLSIRAAAKRIGMPSSTLRCMIHSGKCPFPVFSPSPSLYYISPESIDKWKAACMYGGGTELVKHSEKVKDGALIL